MTTETHTQPQPSQAPESCELDELLAFIGPRPDAYLRQIYRGRKYANASPEFNWMAFLGGPAWCVYRKLYGSAALYLVTLVGSVALAAGFASALDVSEASLELITLMFAFFVRLVWGFTANGIYTVHATREIATAKALCREPSQLDAQIRARGGVNFIGFLVALLSLEILSIAATVFGG